MSSREMSTIGVFAALHAVVFVLPFSLTIGVNGNITLGVVTAPLIGLLLGPLTGGIVVLVFRTTHARQGGVELPVSLNDWDCIYV